MTYVTLFVTGLFVSILATLVIRYISQGKMLHASLAVFLQTAFSVLAVVSIVKLGTIIETLVYSLGVASGTFVAVWHDTKRGAK